MLDFETLIEAAKTLDCAAEVQATQRRAQLLEAREHVNIAVTGSTGSGKTTLVNLAVGQTVRKPSLLPDKAPSLRVAFEKAEDDPRFECVSVVNRAWNEYGAMLYELTGADGRNDALLDEMDVVFYTTPVSAAITQTDREWLKAHRGARTIVVLTGADRLGDGEDMDDLDGLTGYVANLVQELSLDGMIVSDPRHPEQTRSKLLQQIPVQPELSELRMRHAEAILDRTRRMVIESARKALSESAVEMEAAVKCREQARQDAIAAHAEWSAVRAEFFSRGAALALKLADAMRNQAGGIADKLNAQGSDAGYSRDWLKKRLPEYTQQLIREALLDYRQTINQSVHDDLAMALDEARKLGLDSTLAYEKADIETMIQATQPPRPENTTSRYLTSKSGRRLAVMGTVGAGAMIAALTIPGVSATMLHAMPGYMWAALAAGVLAPVYSHDRGQWDKAQWRQTLEKYASDNCNQAAVTLNRGVLDYYETLYGLLTNLVFLGTEDNTGALADRRAELEGILSELETSAEP